MRRAARDIPEHCRVAADQCHAAVARMLPPDAIAALVEALSLVAAESGVSDAQASDLAATIAQQIPGRVAALRDGVRRGRN